MVKQQEPEIFGTWIRPDDSLLVAIQDSDVLAVGCVTDAGEITLNYVSSDVRFRSVSSALLAALESRSTSRGNTRCRLRAPKPPAQFYLARGYSENGASSSEFRTAGGYPMTKHSAF